MRRNFRGEGGEGKMHKKVRKAASEVTGRRVPSMGPVQLLNGQRRGLLAKALHVWNTRCDSSVHLWQGSRLSNRGGKINNQL